MRGPFRNDPRDPWGDDEIPTLYRTTPAAAAEPTVWVDLDTEAEQPFGFQPPRRPRQDGRRWSRQARAIAHLRERLL